MAGKSRIGRSRSKATAQKYNMVVPERNPFEESELHYYKRLAKRADDRLRALEKLAQSGDPDYAGVLEYAYRNAIYETQHISGTMRFSQNIPLTKEGEINRLELNRRTNAIKRFLESPTSTKQGITRIYKQRANTVNQKYGTNFTWQELARFYEHEKAAKQNAEYGSDTVVRALGAIRRIANDPEKIREAAAGNIKVANDKKTNEVAIALLEDGLDLSIFNK